MSTPYSDKRYIVTLITFSMVQAKNMYSTKEQHCYAYFAAIEIFLSVSEIVVQCVAQLALGTGRRVGWLSWCDIVDSSLTRNND